MWKQTIGALRLLMVLTIITGLIYPLVMTGVAQAVFPSQANGSLAYADNKPVGSLLLGQNFSHEKYFHGRISAAGADGYDGTSSSGSNLGATNKKLTDRVKEDLAKIRTENQVGKDKVVPSDLVLASASGLDPHISPAAADYQVERLAKNTGKSESEIRSIIERCTEKPQLGIFGNVRVNVLKVNLMLEDIL